MSARDGHLSFLHGISKGQKQPLKSAQTLSGPERNTQPHLPAPGEDSKSRKGKRGTFGSEQAHPCSAGPAVTWAQPPLPVGGDIFKHSAFPVLLTGVMVTSGEGPRGRLSSCCACSWMLAPPSDARRPSGPIPFSSCRVGGCSRDCSWNNTQHRYPPQPQPKVTHQEKTNPLGFRDVTSISE